jgi:hypothetical protein
MAWRAASKAKGIKGFLFFSVFFASLRYFFASLRETLFT